MSASSHKSLSAALILPAAAAAVAVAKCKLVGQHKMHLAAATFHACLALDARSTDHLKANSQKDFAKHIRIR